MLGLIKAVERLRQVRSRPHRPHGNYGPLTIRKHINNALKEELDNDSSVVAKFATTKDYGRREGQIWLHQQQMAELFATSVPNICTHITNILEDKELDKDSVIKDYLITALDGKQ